MRKQNSELTKAMLLEWGIDSIEWSEEANTWLIDRFWYKNKSKNKRHVAIKIGKSICKHKYTKNKEYPTVTFSYKNQGKCIPLARVIYVWFVEDIEEGMVIDHIDNNPFNNKVENLQKLTPEANLKKRFEDNPNALHNQCRTELYQLARKLYQGGIPFKEAKKLVFELKERGEI